jgi:hypothetical protein
MGVSCGDLRDLYDRELSAIRQGELLKRLCSGDETLWPRAEALSGHFGTSMEFLHIPERLPEIAEAVLREEAEAREEGLTDRALIAFENAHHLCEAFLNIHPSVSPLRCWVLDSSHPSGIHRIESQIDIAKTLFLLVNKSGYRVGDHSLFFVFPKSNRTKTFSHFLSAFPHGNRAQFLPCNYRQAVWLSIHSGAATRNSRSLFFAY